jgi:hypothetical protein
MKMYLMIALTLGLTSTHAFADDYEARGKEGKANTTNIQNRKHQSNESVEEVKKWSDQGTATQKKSTKPSKLSDKDSMRAQNPAEHGGVSDPTTPQTKEEKKKR